MCYQVKIASARHLVDGKPQELGPKMGFKREYDW